MRTAIVTGGSGGIGSAVCRALCAEGYGVAVCYNSGREAAENLISSLVSEGLTAWAVPCDVTDEEQVISAVEETSSKGDLTVAVNCSGVARIAQIQDMSLLELEEIFSVNSSGTYLVCREAAKHMIPLGYGRIINISSMWGVAGASCETAYSASKAAVIGLTKALAKELGPSGITVNCVAPGVIDTKMNSMLSEEDVQDLCDQTPVGRIGKPDDVAQAVIYFCNAPFVTGQVLSVDGGFTL
jgi:3-oxoacyl-[acyl-carrier protein] reductase